MSRITTDEQVNQIWERTEELDLYVTRTKDQWGNEIAIFDSWSDVERVAEIVIDILPAEVLAESPIWEQIKYRGHAIDGESIAYVVQHAIDRRHHIEWAIGDFGFSDQYQTCGHCYVAIDTQDYAGPRYWFDQDQGEITCDTCVRDNFAEDYLAYCAKHLGDDYQRLIASYNFGSPLDHGYICINAASVTGDYAHAYDQMCTELGVTELSDIPQWIPWLNTANDNDLARLHKAAQLIDPDLMIVAQYHKFYSSSYLYWVKFDEYKELPEDNTTRLNILGYAMGLVLSKWHKLTVKDNGYRTR